MSQVYFVRHLGKIRGPFAQDHVGRLVAAGLIGPAAEVSTDRSGWCPLTAHPGFGGHSAPQPVAQHRPSPAPTVAIPLADNFELDLSAILTPAAADAGTGSEWFDNVDLGAMGDV